MKQDYHEQLKPFYSFEKELWVEQRNVSLKINRFEALDKPVIPRGGDGDPDSYRTISPSVHYDGEKFIMWYVGIASKGTINNTQDWFDKEKTSMCIAYSDDGINWEKPKMKESKESAFPASNALFSNKLFLAGVDYIPEQDLYAMGYTYHNGLDTDPAATVFCMAFSKDGIKWERDFKPESCALHFESCVGPKKIGDKYWMIGQGISPYFTLPDGALCTRTAFGYYSSDLKNWKLYPYPLFYYEPEDEYLKKHPLMSYQTHLGFTTWPRKRINLGLLGHFHPAPFPQISTFNNGLVYSCDGLSWQEPFPLTPILAAPEVPWQNAIRGQKMPDDSWFIGVVQGNTIINHNDKTYFWFAGCYDLGYSGQPEYAEIGLATIRRDGFAHFESEGTGKSHIITEPVMLEEKDMAIYLNADASPECPVKVKIMDKYFKPFDNAEFVLTQSGVMEKCAIDLKKIKNQTKEIRLCFEWDGSSDENRLYMFNIGPELNIGNYKKNWLI